MLDPFSDQGSARTIYRIKKGEKKKEEEEFPYRLKPLKMARKAKSLVER